MANMWKTIINAFDWLWVLPLFIWWDQWILDESWVEFMQQYRHLDHQLMSFDFNKAVKTLQFYKMIWLSDNQNDVGIYYH